MKITKVPVVTLAKSVSGWQVAKIDELLWA